MADIAAIFHWSLASLRELALDELLHWRALAIDRWNTMNRPTDG